MRPNSTWSAVALTTSLYCSLLFIVCLNLQVSQATGRRQNNLHRNNLFDPIYAYDDVDAHYVSPSLSSSSLPSSSASRLSPSALAAQATQSGNPSNTNQSDADRLKSLLSRQPDVAVAGNDSLRRVSVAKVAAAESMPTTPPGPRTTSQGAVINSTSAQARESSSGGLTAAESSRVQSVARSGSSRQVEEPPHHWSGLENYYQKLRQAAAVSQRLHQLPAAVYRVPAQDLYEIIQQQQEIDDPYGGYKPLGSYLPGGSVAARHPAAKLNPAFLLPTVGTNNQQQQLLPVISYPDSDNNDNGLTVYHNSAPGISKQVGGIGAGSILLRPHDSDSTSFVAGSQPALTSTTIQLTDQQAGEPLVTIGNDGKLNYLEWRKLPEMLLIQQQQQRVRHQQETFGPWYDQRRSKELLQEEAFCGPRNYVNLQLAQQQTGGDGTKGLDRKYMQAQLARLQAQLNGGSPIKLEDIPALNSQSPGEYPSHVGLYNGSVEDDKFLCAATWIHESFALTLASCVKSISEPGRIMFRLGEWNVNNRNNQSDNDNNNNQRPLIVGQVDQIHLFPKYRNDSFEHNLALVHFGQPVEFLAWPYICPACQPQSRSSIRTSSCWAPSRNVSLIEYFDAEGEGETKERKSIRMVDLPVRLMANDEAECQRQTRLGFFNFQHPNYICSGDYRQSIWRARLNNSDTFGSGIYCNEDGNLSLVSIVHPIHPNSSSAFGYMDLSYYRPWIRNIISGHNY